MKSRGFSGKVTNTSLHDVVQLVCIGRGTCRMHVSSGTSKGVICFKDGEIVHAEYNGLEGEEAFYGILSWELGAFECDEHSDDKATIEESWDFLVMESLRRVDSLRGK